MMPPPDDFLSPLSLSLHFELFDCHDADAIRFSSSSFSLLSYFFFISPCRHCRRFSSFRRPPPPSPLSFGRRLFSPSLPRIATFSSAYLIQPLFIPVIIAADISLIIAIIFIILMMIHYQRHFRFSSVIIIRLILFSLIIIDIDIFAFFHFDSHFHYFIFAFIIFDD
jgi:hypothetical protein